jgi:hypothetical protein
MRKLRFLFLLSILLSVRLFCSSDACLENRIQIPLKGKCVHLFVDDVFGRAYIIDYLNRFIYAIDLEQNKIINEITGSGYPVFLSFHSDTIYVSDFWGHKIDAYDRDNLKYLFSIPCKRGPGYILERGGLLYVASQLEPELQVFLLSTKELLYSFPLKGRVPIFYLLDDLVILPYYDNFHTWSRDFELEDSVAFLNPTTFSWWTIEGNIKKPLHVLRIDDGKYIVSGYLDNGLWSVDWGQKQVYSFVTWKGHSHIMDTVQFLDKIAVSSMSEDTLYFIDLRSKELTEVLLSGGVIDLEPYKDLYLFALSNFDNLLYVIDERYELVETVAIPDYPIAMKIFRDRLLVLNMDEPVLTVFDIIKGK